MAQKIIDHDSKPSIPLAGSFDIKSFSLEDRKVVLKGKNGKNITLELNDKVDVKVDFTNDDGEAVNGVITFSLIRNKIGEYTSNKKVIIEDMLLSSPSRTILKKKKIDMKVTFKGKQIKDGCLNIYQMYLVDKDAEYCVLSFHDANYMDDYFYISVSKDEPNIIEMVGEKKNDSAFMALSKVYFKR